MADPYVYPGTEVLRNLAGLQDADALAHHEAQVPKGQVRGDRFE